ncbi:hypothetical protein REMIM1_CH04170 [Rhizobium etli bv. mimosae str. Mim1]|nr:hypothetical protein REMIM1_CH04170 [Rhizobium etli bv. mimosae str. Mim1]
MSLRYCSTSISFAAICSRSFSDIGGRLGPIDSKEFSSIEARSSSSSDILVVAGRMSSPALGSSPW